MTNEEILKEFNKCAEDPIYFINNYIKIIHPLKGQIPFDLYKFQKRIVSEIDSNRFNVIKKFRQAGVTTIMCAYSLWFIIFQEKKNVMVVSIGDRESTAFLARVVDMYEQLPPWLQPGVRERNKHNLVLQTASRIRSQPAGAGRGESVSLLVVDEAAFIPDMAEFWAAMYPTLSTGGTLSCYRLLMGCPTYTMKSIREPREGKTLLILSISFGENILNTLKNGQRR